MERHIENLRIEDTRLIFRNFAGAPTKFNSAGGRASVGVVLPDVETGVALEKDGWNVKYLKDHDTGEVDGCFITAKVSFAHKPPKLIMVTGGRQVFLDEDSMAAMDYADIQSVDVALAPYIYDPEAPASAYVKTMYIVVEEDEFASKYAVVDGGDQAVPF